jgi:Skp family chaperone for outer membrane proteins
MDISGGNMSKFGPQTSRKMLKYCSVFLGCLFLSCAVRSLEIPLKQSAGGGVTVGYVDMEAVFQEYPETKKAKNEYYTELTKRREVLSQKERELADLRQQLAVLRGTLSESSSSAPPAGQGTGSSVSTATTSAAMMASTSSVASVNATILDRERVLSQKEAELEQARIEAAKAVKDLEESRSLQILGKLYNALVQLADENNISLIVDKSSILYGHQAIDLTEKLRRRIRGLPDADLE